MPSTHPKTALLTRGLRATASFGQNFLTSDAHLHTIAEQVLAGLGDGVVVELGAGLGALTHQLLLRGATVHAVERDRDLVPLLIEEHRAHVDAGQLKVHEANALTFPIEEPLANGGALCGNLPYHLTSSLCFRALDVAHLVSSVVFLVQLEVAERLCAKPGNKQWGTLSVLLSERFDTQLVRRVPAGAFWPVPDVDGGVVVLRPHRASDDDVDREQLKAVVKCAFHKRRKTIKNGLKHLPDHEACLIEAGIDLRARAESLPVASFVALAKAFSARGVTVVEPGKPAPKDPPKDPSESR